MHDLSGAAHAQERADEATSELERAYTAAEQYRLHWKRAEAENRRLRAKLDAANESVAILEDKLRQVSDE